jgi:hypothetical protein
VCSERGDHAAAEGVAEAAGDDFEISGCCDVLVERAQRGVGD